MFVKSLLVLFLFQELAAVEDVDFIFNGFRGANINLGGIATIKPNGLLMLTNSTQLKKGHAFCRLPLQFKYPSRGNETISFSTVFVFAIVPQDIKFSGHGIAFVISPSDDLQGGLPAQYFGLFNASTNGNLSNHVVAVELDTILNDEFGDINNNHVGIDINGLNSVKSIPAAYYEDGGLKNLSMSSGEPIQIWIEYDGIEKKLRVTLSPINVPKPSRPLLSITRDLSTTVLDDMYIGFSAATGLLVASHYILGWSFKLNGRAQALDPSLLPSLPRRGPKEKSRLLTIGLPLVSVTFTLAIISVIIVIVRRKIKFAEIVEDWEREYGPHRFSYKDLFMATKGFREKQLLGRGGFGSVYKGVLPASKIEIAVKRVSHDSKQGLREFIAEIMSLGRLRHRNLVQLLGYCRRKGELLLVYDFMPNGSLDKLLFGENTTLNWTQRFKIVKGVASGLLYLHEEWEQVVIHRDIKASNVLLDADWNGRLGDFGLARLYDHGTDPSTTHVVGTLGYLAPELTRTSKMTTSTDVFAFGAFMLEVATGRKPIDPRDSGGELVLVDWVIQCRSRGAILEVCDPKLGNDYVAEEMELVLKLGLLCSHPNSLARPTMRQVVQFLDGNAQVPEFRGITSKFGASQPDYSEGFDDLITPYPSSIEMVSSYSTVSDSLLSGGR